MQGESDRAAQEPLRKRRVVVLGAGIAGLTSAGVLQLQGCDVTVLEARNRLGGRCFTSDALGYPLDLGAAWIHGPVGHALYPVVRGKGLPTYSTSDEDSFLFDHDLNSYAFFDVGGVPVPQHVVDRVAKAFQKVVDAIAEQVEHVSTSAEDMPLSAIMAKTLERMTEDTPIPFDGSTVESRMLCWFLARWEGWFAASSEQISAVWANEELPLHGGHRILVRGHRDIVHELAEGLDVRLNDPVKHIARVDGKSWEAEVARNAKVGSPHPIVVETVGGHKHVCDAVVVALPLGVLQRHSEELFAPALPRWKTDALRHMGVGSENKIILRFEESFWPPVDILGCVGPSAGQCSYFLNIGKPTGLPMLVYMPAGVGASALEEKSDADTVDHVMGVLRRMFPGLQIPDPIAFVVTRWGKDPHSLGAYSYFPVGFTDADSEGVQNPVGPLHFAGEYVSPAYMGTTHGAAVTGMKAAAEIMSLLGLGRARLAFAEASLTTPPTSRSKTAGKRLGAVAGAGTDSEPEPKAKL